MSTAMLPSHDTDTCPRAAAWMAGLAVAAGDRETAGMWLLELIAWIAFDSGRTHAAIETSSSATVAELRC